MTTPIRQFFLLAAEGAVRLLADPAVADRWNEPSALDKFSVNGLAGHLALQILHVRNLLAAPLQDAEIGTLDEHYAPARWTEPIDSPAHVRVRDRGEEVAANGARQLAAETAAVLAELRASVPEQPDDRLVYVPWTESRLRFDDFLLTRTLELTIHSDDLAVSVGVPTPELPTDVYGPVILVLTKLAVRRHGPLAVLRALSRRERAPETIAAI